MATIRASAVFKLDPKGFDLRRGISGLVVMLLPLIVLGALGQEKYFLSVAFGALFTGLCDPGGKYSYRAPRLGSVAVVGALLTALGYWLGGAAWGWVVLAAFVVTMLAGLAAKYGAHRFTAALLLNIWFLVALALPRAYQADHVQTTAWPQALAWLIGATLMIGFIGVMWLAGGQSGRRQTGAELFPQDTTPVPVTAPMIMYAVIRAVAVAFAVAITFGLKLPNGDWMAIAALIAMKPNLQQSTLVGLQRLAGAAIGAGVATAFLLGVDSKIALGVIIVLLGGLAGAIRAVNYAWYCAAVAATVLIAEDIGHPTNLSEEGRRVAFTFAGVGIAILVTSLATLLAKHAATPDSDHQAPGGRKGDRRNPSEVAAVRPGSGSSTRWRKRSPPR
ncbi:FUSC family protein [Actinoplanes sp. KI2]|uniref:FUSC family protein n=1 Tax=Actinoplanes sp. KI2 TaxID=2983315 RepID=UPI0021D5AA23|nr:FUSC family protein [Actinoplanes sp. KI2]MCU7725791.1 FUSC family protein [Actinoplanes sp. KI2]